MLLLYLTMVKKACNELQFTFYKTRFYIHLFKSLRRIKNKQIAAVLKHRTAKKQIVLQTEREKDERLIRCYLCWRDGNTTCVSLPVIFPTKPEHDSESILIQLVVTLVETRSANQLPFTNCLAKS